MKLVVSLLCVLVFAFSFFAQIPQVRLDPFITSGLSSPLFMTSSRDGTNRLFIVQQGGIIRVVQPNSTTPTDFLNITSRVLSGGERGLLGLAFHPQYAQNGRFFVYYTRQTDGAIQIGEYRVSVSNPNVADPTEKIIITIPHPGQSNHNGGTVAFGPDGYLYAGPGDGGGANDPSNNAQNINQLLGKIIRLDIDNVPVGQTPQYNIPPTNPFAGATPGADEIYAVGMRNPYRFSFDRGASGHLWAADVGQASWEEVDIIVNGGNYGWRLYEGDHCTNIGGAGCAFPPNYVGPVFEYSSAGSGNPRCSVTGGFVYRGPAGTFPDGGYVYGDYCSGEVLVWTSNQQRQLLDTTRLIVGFGEDEAGELYMIGQSGSIEKIVSVSPTPTPTPPTPTVTPTPTPTATPMPSPTVSPTPTPTPTPSPAVSPTPAPSPSPTANTPTGTNVNVQAASGDADLTFAIVTSPGTTTFTAVDPDALGMPLPAGYTIFNPSSSPSPAYDIVTNATFSGPITVCLVAPQTISEPDFRRLRILHGENGFLVDRTILAPDAPAPDFPTRTACARVDSLSPVVLAIAPPQSGLSISGRVLTPSGQGVRNVAVILTDTQGVRRVATTSSFGVYTFENVPAGPNYILGAISRRYRFAPRIFDLNGNLNNVDFIGLE